MQFAHLHCHTQFSLLDGASSIPNMLDKAVADNMMAAAITDHGNMFGVFKFVAEANKRNIKPIVGCEFYLVEDRFKKTFTKEAGDNRYHQLLLAKDQAGYQNLAKLCSLGFMEGLYSKYPRIDKRLVEEYHEGLIATTCCLGARVPQMILTQGEEAAEKEFKWWLDLFGEDYYIELQRHNLPEQDKVNAVLMRFAKKYNVKMIASNDSHYVQQSDSNAHDILLCINTGAKQSQQKGDEKGQRFAFPNDEFYFKSTQEMSTLFADVPEAIDNTMEIVSKVTPPKLQRDILLPHFPIPAPFQNADEYLRHLTFEGARKRYKILTPEVEERLNFELEIIIKMGFSGYFLIVSDFIRKGKEIGVMIGPGRGSAAGSAVAYCIEITNIDPIKYNLLFERFLNPERVSMPDIDTDFDEEGRQKVIDYVVEAYGKNQVAQIITYGTMAAKMAINDVTRVVMDEVTPEIKALPKLIPDTPGISLQKAIADSKELQEIMRSGDQRAEILKQAMVLEGSVRNVGTHASAVIIAPDDITKYIPVSVAKDSDLLVTQFDGKVIESAGMLKMDFLGLTNLNNIQDTLRILAAKGIEIDVDEIPLEDEKTFELFQRGETVAVFQFESAGMQKYLKELKPTNIEDLIAMNALYRPGPMDYIPLFVSRKHGREVTEYPHPALEELLKPTYGIMVYQEQIMLTAQIMAGYSLGGADLLRRAMGKKDANQMAKEREKFVKGAAEVHQLTEKKANEIFDIMEKFAQYGFNRSHAAAYSVLAYKTAYLKAHYPAEYMAAVMTRKSGDVSVISFLSEECRRMGIEVLGPNVNESDKMFTVNSKGNIRFSLSAIKGFGEGAADDIIKERKQNGEFKDFFDMMQRVNLRSVNKRAIEALAYAGALDDFNGGNRAQYFYPVKEGMTFIEQVSKWAAMLGDRKASAVGSLFGSVAEDKTIPQPTFPKCEPWSNIEQLRHEETVTGFFLSGHPLDNYKRELQSFTNTNVERLSLMKDREVVLGGMITKPEIRLDKNGNKYARFKLQDFSATLEMMLFSENYLKAQNYIEEGKLVLIRGNYQARWKNSEDYDLKIRTISLLSELRENETKAVDMIIATRNATTENAESIKQICEANPGRCLLGITVFDEQDQTSVRLVAKQYKISPSEEVLSQLEFFAASPIKLK